MLKNSNIFFNSGIQLNRVGVNIKDNSNVNTSYDLVTLYNQIMSKVESVQDGVVPLTKELIFYNDFKIKEQSIPLQSQIYAYYYSNSSYLNKGSLSFYKKGYDDVFYHYICDIENAYGIIDYNIQSGGYYHYLISYKNPFDSIYVSYETIDDKGEPEYIQPKWDFWTICNIEQSENDENVYIKKGSVWKLRYNMENPTITQNTSVTTWDTLGRYPKYSVGQRNYSSAQFSALLGDICEYVQGSTEETEDGVFVHTEKNKFGYTEKANSSNSYSREVEKYENWKEFVSDGELKLLKDYKGNSWVVYIQETSSAVIDMQSNILETSINFEWIEALDVNSISIISDSILR